MITKFYLFGSPARKKIFPASGLVPTVPAGWAGFVPVVPEGQKCWNKKKFNRIKGLRDFCSSVCSSVTLHFWTILGGVEVLSD